MHLVTLLTVFLVGTAVVQYVKCDSAIVLFFFQRLMFGHFHDALVESRDVIRSHFGVVEVLSYKIIVYPDTRSTSLVNGTYQDRTHSICVISFDTKASAEDWLLTDPLVTRKDTWSYGTEVNIVLVNLALSRHYPFSLYRKAHVIALLTPTNHSTEFSSLVVAGVTRIYAKYGGNDMAMATMDWQRVVGVTWPPTSVDWLFYGPVADMDSVKNLFKSNDVINIGSVFPTSLKRVQFYGMDSFFNTGNSVADFRSWTLPFQCLCIVVHVIKLYN